ncbi:MAG: hypothetical protein HQM08_25995 [Candidatus Riflebacteria bacterium]|nr:hypothetical protein [Candidatus Riflebacteria bacterium]
MKFALNKVDKATLKREIAEAHQAEVLSAATISPEGEWHSLRILARGTLEEAPAIIRGLRPGDIMLHNHPNGYLEPSQPDFQIASICGKSGIGFAIHDNSCKECYVVVEPFQPEAIKPLDFEPLFNHLRENGSLSKMISDFHERSGQIEMMEKIVEAFNEPCHAVLEGGTGIGKSMAYLIPSIYFARMNKCRVAISTNTINLQYQLFNKDLPLLKKALPLDFKFCLIKGRGNYLCQRRVSEIQKQAEGETLLSLDEFDDFVRLLEWSQKTSDGSLSDLSWVPEESLWEKLNSDKDTCTGLKCPMYKSCFFYRARREAAEADILVINHYLLFSDIALRSATDEYSQTAVIPAYRAAILDEAHNIEDIATTFFGNRVSAFGLQKQLGRLYHKRGRKEGGLLVSFLNRILLSGNPSVKLLNDKMIAEIRENIIPLKNEISDQTREFFDEIASFVLKGKEIRQGEEKLRITRMNREVPLFKELTDKSISVVENLKKLKRKVSGIQNLFGEIVEDTDEATEKLLEGPVIEMAGVAKRLIETVEALELFFSPDVEKQAEFVHFFSVMVRKDSRWPSITSAPIDVSEEMVNSLFNRIPTVILVSATLSTQKSFTFIRSRIGLDSPDLENEAIEGNFSSPFDYMKQAILFVPDDLPEPSNPNFIESTKEPLFRIILSSAGGTLVLCTSYKHLREVYEALKQPLSEQGITCLKQGDYERHHLLEIFKDDGNAVLFATDSFWEGVDVPGNALRNLVIAKLPFVMPDDPILVARQEVLERLGKNPFAEYQLPIAAIKLKQGFGRLIRKTQDRGTIWILDRRIVTKFYGKYLIDSLPKTKLISGAFKKILDEGKKFFKSNSGVLVKS